MGDKKTKRRKIMISLSYFLKSGGDGCLDNADAVGNMKCDDNEAPAWPVGGRCLWKPG
jgi:hypothetical protein